MSLKTGAHWNSDIGKTQSKMVSNVIVTVTESVLMDAVVICNDSVHDIYGDWLLSPKWPLKRNISLLFVGISFMSYHQRLLLGQMSTRQHYEKLTWFWLFLSVLYRRTSNPLFLSTHTPTLAQWGMTESYWLLLPGLTDHSQFLSAWNLMYWKSWVCLCVWVSERGELKEREREET